MKRIFLVAALAVMPLSTGCTTLGESPSVIADQTVLDEHLLEGVELAYKAMRLALEFGVDAGKITGTRATQCAELDNRAYAAVQAARAAYRAGNAQAYPDAVIEALKAVTAVTTAIKGNGP